MAEHVGNELPGCLLAGCGNLAVYHVVVAVVGVWNRFAALEGRVGDYHPVLAVVEVGIGFCHSLLLVETGQVHSDFVLVIIEYLARCGVGGRSEVLSVWTEVCHVLKRFDPGRVVDDRLPAVVGNELAAELLDHREPADQIVSVAEVEASPSDYLAVALDDFLGQGHDVFPGFRIVLVRIEARVPEYFLVKVNAPVGQFERETVDLSVDGDRAEHAGHVAVLDFLVGLVSCSRKVHRSDKAFSEEGIGLLDFHIEDVRAVFRGETGLDDVLDLVRRIGDVFDRDIWVGGHKLGDILFFERLAVGVFVGPNGQFNRTSLFRRFCILCAACEYGHGTCNHRRSDRGRCQFQKCFLHEFLLGEQKSGFPETGVGSRKTGTKIYPNDHSVSSNPQCGNADKRWTILIHLPPMKNEEGVC
ncbi:MAG: hypothetical protein BWY39_01501 [Spirochaetes bacterium ADurb.Bin269]|nr:MAG: hypothetical protein BWY39_01501 [Spirochaetes bacterium ADurb.Bin269]